MAMKRGFLNSPRYKRALEDQTNPSSSPCDTQYGGKKAKVATAEDAMDVDKTTMDHVFGTGKATTRSPGSKGTLPARGGTHDGTTEPRTKDPKGKGKGKEKATSVGTEWINALLEESGDPAPSLDADPESIVLERFPPRRPGWGRHPDEEYLHTVPSSHGGPYVKRAIFRQWPRRPGGMLIRPNAERPKGTLSPDGYPWAATLYDLYCVHRVPEIQGMITYMTGSVLLEEMKALNELDAAAPEIEWALTEGKPRDEGAADTEELIWCMDTRVQMLSHGWHLGDVTGEDLQDQEGENQNEEDGEDGEEIDSGGEENCNDDANDDDNEDEDMKVDPASIPPPPAIPITSPFHRSHYSEKWPFIPFDNEKPISILLQERIPLYLLPRTLYVHDPFNLLHACQRRFCNTSWKSRPDIVRTYNLKLSESVRKNSEEARKRAEELEEFKARTLIILRYKRTKEQIKNFDPMIEVPLPPYQRRKTKTEESHLYISPVAKVGVGHHSIVYKGEWELPRDIFVKQKICAQCFKESADKEIKRLKDTKRWAKLLRAAAWGPKGFTGRQPTAAELATASDPVNLQRDDEIIERELICVVPPNASPSKILSAINERNVWDIFTKKRDSNTAILDFAAQGAAENKGESTEDYVATIRIDPKYESEDTCTHRPPNPPTSRTAKFTVIAKLSLEYDDHLAREARNYQQFPGHFFCHYDGYTIIPQLHAVVPIHAVVPQFYGYYVPQKDKTGNRRGGSEPYLSPILLLEHCGKPIDPESLSVEDQEECASLVLRFQRAGWLHESMAPRNLLVQKGKPTEFPLTRQIHPELSFRLIDFGRSCKYKTAEEKRSEEQASLGMFQKLVGKMGVTLF